MLLLWCAVLTLFFSHEMGGEEPRESGVADDPRFWDSFRENVAENPANAIAFFDMVVGLPPNWAAPDVPWMRRTFLDRKRSLEGGRASAIE